MGKGSPVVDEMILPVTDVYLANGAICIVDEVHGPARAVDSGEYTVHDSAGGLVYRSRGDSGRIAWRAVKAGKSLYFTARVRVEQKTATPCDPF